MNLDIRSLALFAISWITVTGASFVASAGQPTALLVDKKKSQLHVAHYVDGEYQILKTYHTTLGQVKGDKEDEGDLKTPEGIYTFTHRIPDSKLPKKFGSMAINLNFPNTFDRMAGRSGSNIWLHATDTPERLKQNYDSLGCVVVQDEEIREIFPYIRIGLTPILIFPELNEVWMKPGRDQSLQTFFQAWVSAWEQKAIEPYMDSYHTDFAAQGKDKKAWRTYKESLNQRYSSIEIRPEQIQYYRHPKYSMITFTQNYRSQLKGGGWGHRSRGTKILYVAEESGKPKIIAETYTELMW